MVIEDADARQAVLDKLAQTRDEIRQYIDPSRNESEDGAAAPNSGDEFPRSRTMRALLSSRGVGAVGALAGGLLIARPALALRLLRLVPVSTVGRMLIAKAFTLLRAKRES